MLIFDNSLVVGIKCLSCGQEEGIECNSDHVGNEVHWQIENPELGNFGDACYVAHDGKYTKSIQNSCYIHR